MTHIAVAGAGLVGRRHASALAAASGVDLCAVVDPAPAGREVAENWGVPWFADIAELLDAGLAEGVILATPNQLHRAGAMACIDADVPVLVEKPLADSVAAGAEMVDAAASRCLPILTGHHRRHNDLVRAAKREIGEGRLGTLTAVQAQFWLMKPDSYFEVAWRRQKGAGPVYINLIHDIDLLQFLCGPIVEVQAWESNRVRRHDVEETAVILLRFADGLLGTVNVCDAAVAPWSWELTARENAHYPATDETCYWIGGTHGSLSLPHPTLWTNPGERSWWEPISATRLKHDFADPLVRQAAHFGAVIRGEAAPVASGADGLAALRVVEAVKRSAAAGGAAVAPASL